jgi:hypothetical protein
MLGILQANDLVIDLAWCLDETSTGLASLDDNVEGRNKGWLGRDSVRDIATQKATT